MRPQLSFLIVIVAIVAATAFKAWADSPITANQGKPGNQGPWPVRLVGSDGGSSSSSSTTTQAPCSVYRETNTSVGTSAAIVPATPLANRIWVRICNSLLNTEGAQCICSGTTTPTFAASSSGDPLAVSDCATYPITAADAGVPLCICNGAGVRLPATECVAP